MFISRLAFRFLCAGQFLLLAFIALGPVCYSRDNWLPLVDDPLIDSRLVSGENSKESIGGVFTAQGWRAGKQGDFLKIRLSETAMSEGALEVTLSGIVWDDPKSAGVANRKIHFLNMFSNEIGDHHAEDGGTATDALWTLRVGIKDGKPRYGNGFKALWSSRGAKRSKGSLYHETKIVMPDDWRWREDESYRFRVEWSAEREFLRIFVNEILLDEFAWVDQRDNLDTIFIGKAGDFGTWVGPVFSDLKVWRRE